MTADGPNRSQPGVPLMWRDMTVEEFTRVTAGELPPLVPEGKPPPADMPPLTLMVLETLAEDAETIYTMRNCGDMAPFGLALVGEAHIRDTLRTLLADGLVEIESEYVIVDGRVYAQAVVGQPEVSDGALQRYWFQPTPAGIDALETAYDELAAYWDAHPLEPSDRGQ
jgi:hypothetical protein